MGLQLLAHRLDKKGPDGVDPKPFAEMDCGREGEMSKLLGLKFNPDAASMDEAGVRVSRPTLEAAMRHCCSRHAAGEDYLWELLFFATVLSQWPAKEKSIFLLLM